MLDVYKKCLLEDTPLPKELIGLIIDYLRLPYVEDIKRLRGYNHKLIPYHQRLGNGDLITITEEHRRLDCYIFKFIKPHPNRLGTFKIIKKRYTNKKRNKFTCDTYPDIPRATNRSGVLSVCTKERQDDIPYGRVQSPYEQNHYNLKVLQRELLMKNFAHLMVNYKVVKDKYLKCTRTAYRVKIVDKDFESSTSSNECTEWIVEDRIVCGGYIPQKYHIHNTSWDDIRRLPIFNYTINDANEVPNIKNQGVQLLESLVPSCSLADQIVVRDLENKTTKSYKVPREQKENRPAGLSTLPQTRTRGGIDWYNIMNHDGRGTVFEMRYDNIFTPYHV